MSTNFPDLGAIKKIGNVHYDFFLLRFENTELLL